MFVWSKGRINSRPCMYMDGSYWFGNENWKGNGKLQGCCFQWRIESLSKNRRVDNEIGRHFKNNTSMIIHRSSNINKIKNKILLLLLVVSSGNDDDDDDDINEHFLVMILITPPPPFKWIPPNLFPKNNFCQNRNQITNYQTNTKTMRKLTCCCWY